MHSKLLLIFESHAAFTTIILPNFFYIQGCLRRRTCKRKNGYGTVAVLVNKWLMGKKQYGILEANGGGVDLCLAFKAIFNELSITTANCAILGMFKKTCFGNQIRLN